MNTRHLLRVAVLSLLGAPLLASAFAIAGGQSGTESTGGSGGGNVPRSRSVLGRKPRSSSESRQRPSVTLVSGIVVMEDGGSLPAGTVIERVCGGRPKREATADSLGRFAFELGQATAAFADAAENVSGGAGDVWTSRPTATATAPGFSAPRPLTFLGCELRAHSPGYRSSTVVLGAGLSASLEQLDVGTIVLSPVDRVRGTTVSLVSMQAPKEAKKALEQAEAALERGRPADAEKLLRKAISCFPRHASAWHELGELYRRDERLDDARAAFTQALDADPNYVKPYIGLARLAGLQQKWLEVAELTERATGLNPIDFPESFYFNAIANFQLGRLDEAERSARKALRLDSAHLFPQAHLLVSQILASRNDAEGEAGQLRGYLKYAPPGANADRVRERLAELERTPNAQANRKAP